MKLNTSLLGKPLIFGLVMLGLIVLDPPVFPVAAQNPQRDRQLTLEASPQRRPATQRRIALVMGNGLYRNVSPLANPVNDAQDIVAVLRQLGFELVGGRAHVNQTADQMKQLIVQFGEELSHGGVGLFYYAGHGVQAQGHNYLIPVEANILREKTLEFDAVDVNRVLAEMDAAGNGFNIVIMDACRNNPFSRSWRDAGQGLAQVNAPEGTLIAYATSPGRVANDGTGRNGTYTAQLLRQMRVPSMTIEEMFKAVRVGVKAATNNQQTPWESSSLVGEFCFAGSCESPNKVVSNVTTGTDVLASNRSPDEEFWQTIRSSADREDFRAYLATFPNGRYVAIARNNLRRMEAADVARKTAAATDHTAGAKTNRDEIVKKSNEIIAKNAEIAKSNEVVIRTFRAGNEAIKAKNYDEAISQFNEGLTADPEHPGAPSLLTNKATALNSRAVATYNTAIRSNDDAAKAAGLESAKKDWREAFEASSKAVEILSGLPTPADAIVASNAKTNLYFALLVKADASRFFVTKVDPEKADAGAVAFQDYIAAEADPAKRLKAEHDLAQMLFDANAFDKALAQYQKLLQANPEDLDALLRSGIALFNLGALNNDRAKYQRAVDLLARFMDKAPDTHAFKADAKAILDTLREQQNVKPVAAPSRRQRP